MADGWQHSTVAHVPMPFCTPGSTLLGVVSQLSRVHRDQGGRSLAVLSDNRGLDLPDVENVFVDHTQRCPREYFSKAQIAVDVAAAALGRPRPHFGRLHDASIAAVRAAGADLVILYEGHYAAASLPAWSALRPEVTVVLYVHNPLSRTYGRRELRRMAEQCDAMVFCADHLRDDAARRMPGTRRPLVTVHNGIDPAFLRQPADPTATPVAPTAEVEVLFIGRTVAHKGPQHLIEALTLAQARTSRRLRGTVVGSDNYGLGGELSPFELELRAAAAASSVPIDFVPHVDRAESVRLMRRASMLCLPSVWSEGLPLVALEGLATGIPIVAFETAGIAEACADTALYAPIGDVAALARRIAECADDPAATERRVAAGRDRAAGFSWERAWSEFGGLTAAGPTPSP
ncbi:MAG: glycosyltransferase family 4 protein [Propionibacteriaceae bacterium]